MTRTVRFRIAGLVAAFTAIALGASAAPAAARGVPVPTLKGVPAFINQSLRAIAGVHSYMTTESTNIDMGFVKEKLTTKGYWVNVGGVIKNYDVTSGTSTYSVGTQSGTKSVLSFSYMDPTKVCSRASAAAAWKCTPNKTNLTTKFLPFVSVSHVKLLPGKVIQGQRALGAVLTIDVNLAGAASAGGLPSQATSALGNASMTATYWVSAKTFLPFSIAVSGLVSTTPTTVVYSDWNSRSVQVPNVP